MPKVSVIIPSYNHAQFIGQAVKSILNQSEQNFEIIIVDDGSTDDTLAYLIKLDDSRIRIFAQENRGAHTAINRGIAEAKGDYLAILNSDDVYHPRRLEKLLTVLEQNPNVGLVGSYIEVISGDGKRLGIKHGYKDLEPWPLPNTKKSFRSTDDARGVLLTENFYATTSNFVFRRELYEQVGSFRSLRYTHDWDFLLRSALVTHLEMVPETLLQYRVHASNTIHENDIALAFEICWCLAVHLPQHLRDATWFTQMPPEQQVERLLNSIYTFQCEPVLSVMLLRYMQGKEVWAEELLSPHSPERKVYIQFIENCLHQKETPTARESSLSNLIKYLYGKLKYVRH